MEVKFIYYPHPPLQQHYEKRFVVLINIWTFLNMKQLVSLSNMTLPKSIVLQFICSIACRVSKRVVRCSEKRGQIKKKWYTDSTSPHTHKGEGSKWLMNKCNFKSLQLFLSRACKMDDFLSPVWKYKGVSTFGRNNCFNLMRIVWQKLFVSLNKEYVWHDDGWISFLLRSASSHKGKIRGRGWLLFFVDFFHTTCKRHLFIPNDVL